MDELLKSIPAEVKVNPAQGKVTLILLHCWFSPTAKCLEIREALNVVIVGVPERN